MSCSTSSRARDQSPLPFSLVSRTPTVPGFGRGQSRLQIPKTSTPANITVRCHTRSTSPAVKAPSAVDNQTRAREVSAAANLQQTQLSQATSPVGSLSPRPRSAQTSSRPKCPTRSSSPRTERLSPVSPRPKQMPARSEHLSGSSSPCIGGGIQSQRVTGQRTAAANVVPSRPREISIERVGLGTRSTCLRAASPRIRSISIERVGLGASVVGSTGRRAPLAQGSQPMNMQYLSKRSISPQNSLERPAREECSLVDSSVQLANERTALPVKSVWQWAHTLSPTEPRERTSSVSSVVGSVEIPHLIAQTIGPMPPCLTTQNDAIPICIVASPFSVCDGQSPKTKSVTVSRGVEFADTADAHDLSGENELRDALSRDRRVSSFAGKEVRVRARTSLIVDAALASVVPGEDAMHPDRARVGQAVVQNVCELINVHSPYKAPQDGTRRVVSGSGARSASPVLKGSQISRPSLLSGIEAVIAELFFDSMPRVGVEIESIARVSEKSLLKKLLAKMAEQRSSIEATFHGTHESNIARIVAEGLSTNNCQRGIFGKGAYVGTHAGLAHKYTSVGKGGKRHMFLVLVDVGLQIVQGEKGARHTVTAVDQEWNPSQYCFVDESRLCVSHLITYIALDKGSYSRALSSAVVRSGTRAQRHGVR